MFRADLADDVARTDAFFGRRPTFDNGAALFEKSAMMHMGRYVNGLAEAATRI